MFNIRSATEIALELVASNIVDKIQSTVAEDTLDLEKSIKYEMNGFKNVEIGSFGVEYAEDVDQGMGRSMKYHRYVNKGSSKREVVHKGKGQQYFEKVMDMDEIGDEFFDCFFYNL